MMVPMMTQVLAEFAPQAPGGGGGNNNLITEIFTGIAALIGAYSAYRLTKNGNDADELRRARRDLAEAESRLNDQQDDIVDLWQYVFRLRQFLAQNGIQNVPEPPVLRTQRGSGP